MAAVVVDGRKADVRAAAPAALTVRRNNMVMVVILRFAWFEVGVRRIWFDVDSL